MAMPVPGKKSPACIESGRWSKVWPQGDLKILHGKSLKQKPPPCRHLVCLSVMGSSQTETISCLRVFEVFLCDSAVDRDTNHSDDV